MHHRNLLRPALIAGAALALTSSPLAAQANTNTTSTAGIVAQDTVRRDVDHDRGFPWGLLGLLGLAGLLGRRKEERVVETVRSVPPTGRPGDPMGRP